MARGRIEEDDNGDLPWLAPAEPEERGAAATVSPGRMRVMLFLLAGLLILVVALLYAAVAKPEDDELVYAENGEVPLIRAPDAPFKEKPGDPGGMDVEGVDQTTYAAAGGVDPGGELALDALPEEPMERPAPAPRPQVARAPVAEPGEAGGPALELAVPEPPRAPEAAVIVERQAPKLSVRTVEPAKSEPVVVETVGDTGSFSLQLGAFSSSAKANAAWKNFSTRYAYLDGLEKAVDKVERDDETLYRLRATGLSSRSQANNLCARLRVAGEACVVAD